MAASLFGALAAAGGQLGPEPLDDATLLHVSGKSGLAGTYQGREAILRLLARMTDLTDGTLGFAPAATLVADGRMVVVCGDVAANRQADRLDTGMACVVVLRGACIREMWLACRDQAAFDDFWR